MLALPLLAQNNGPPVGAFFILFSVCCGFYLLALIPWIFFLRTLSQALAQCHPSVRTMEPGQVWLNLIPLFSYVWIFITQIRVAESLREEFRDRGWHRRTEDYGQTMGITSSALILGSQLMSYCGLPVLVAGFVCWILYWMKIADLGRQLAFTGEQYEDEYDDDYYVDENDHRYPDDGGRDERDRRDRGDDLKP
ncbi:MAG TPA: hypothetical protein VGE74_14765 [Gemmata sp.]